MAPSDPWKRYLDAGMEITNLTRRRAEKIVKEFVKEGTVRGEQAQERVEELLDRSRKASEQLLGVVRTEVTRQMQSLGLVEPAKTVTSRAKAPAKKAGSAAKKSAGTAKKAVKKSTAAAKKTTAAAKKAAGQS